MHEGVTSEIGRAGWDKILKGLVSWKGFGITPTARDYSSVE